MQLSLHSTRWGLVVRAASGVIGAAFTALIGSLLIAGGHSFAWGFFPLAGAQLFTLGFYMYIARLPFPYFEEDIDAADLD